MTTYKYDTRSTGRTNGGVDEGEEFDPEDWNADRILAFLPDAATEKQARILVAAIRNPRRSISDIARIVGEPHVEVRQTVTSYARGCIGDFGHANERGQRYAVTFDELTPKQQAIIDYCARHGILNIAGNKNATGGSIVAAIEKNGGPVIHNTTPYGVLEDYPDLLEERYNYYVNRGELDDPDLYDDRFVDMETYELLTLSEFPTADLPPENLDEVPDTPVPQSRFSKGGAAWQAINEADDEPDANTENPMTSDTADSDSNGNGSEQTALPFYEAGEYEMLPDTATREDVEWQTAYYARVNNTDSGMVFISLNNFENWNDVNGAVYRAGIPRPYNESSFAVGDEIVVGLYKRRDDGKLTFNIIETIDTLKGVSISRPEYLQTLPNPDAQPEQAESGSGGASSEASPPESEAEDEAPEQPDTAEADAEESEDEEPAAEPDEQEEDDAAAPQVVARLEALEARMDEFAERADDLEQRFDRAAEDLVDAAMAVEAQAESVAASVERDADELAERLAALEAGAADAEKVDRRLAELEESLGDQINDVEAALTRRLEAQAEERAEPPAPAETEAFDSETVATLNRSGVSFIGDQLARLAEEGYEIKAFARNDLGNDVEVSVTLRGDDTEDE